MIPSPLSRARTGRELISGVFQGAAGNCASIGVIKCAIAAVGTYPVYRAARVDGDLAIVQLQDGQEVALQPAELATASRLAAFAGPDAELRQHAEFLFAVMAKSAQEQDNDGRAGRSIEAAIASLNDGEYWTEAPRWLGIGHWVVMGPNSPMVANPLVWNFLTQHDFAVAKSPAHVRFATRGACDNHGHIAGWTERLKLSGCYTLDPTRPRQS